MFGAIEAGGTKFVLAAANSPGELNRVQIPTSKPEETLGHVVAFFRANPVEALGLACFGPVDLARGVITETPKLAWRNFPIVELLKQALQIPVALDTDVNAAALGEQAFGAAQGCSNFVYFTIGTGIGGAAIIDGHLLHGAVHAEMGHIPVRRHSDDSFAGVCPSHKDCLEGLASGPAITARWGAWPRNLPPDHAAWKLEAHYLAQAARAAAMMLSPELVIFGGGVSNHPGLIEQTQADLTVQVNGYLANPPRLTRSALESAGLLGALLLASKAQRSGR